MWCLMAVVMATPSAVNRMSKIGTGVVQLRPGMLPPHFDGFTLHRTLARPASRGKGFFRPLRLQLSEGQLPAAEPCPLEHLHPASFNPKHAVSITAILQGHHYADACVHALHHTCLAASSKQRAYATQQFLPGLSDLNGMSHACGGLRGWVNCGRSSVDASGSSSLTLHVMQIGKSSTLCRQIKLPASNRPRQHRLTAPSAPGSTSGMVGVRTYMFHGLIRPTKLMPRQWDRRDHFGPIEDALERLRCGSAGSTFIAPLDAVLNFGMVSSSQVATLCCLNRFLSKPDAFQSVLGGWSWGFHAACSAALTLEMAVSSVRALFMLDARDRCPSPVNRWDPLHSSKMERFSFDSVYPLSESVVQFRSSSPSIHFRTPWRTERRNPHEDADVNARCALFHLSSVTVDCNDAIHMNVLIKSGWDVWRGIHSVLGQPTLPRPEREGEGLQLPTLLSTCARMLHVCERESKYGELWQARQEKVLGLDCGNRANGLNANFLSAGIAIHEHALKCHKHMHVHELQWVEPQAETTFVDIYNLLWLDFETLSSFFGKSGGGYRSAGSCIGLVQGIESRWQSVHFPSAWNLSSSHCFAEFCGSLPGPELRQGTVLLWTEEHRMDTPDLVVPMPQLVPSRMCRAGRGSCLHCDTGRGGFQFNWVGPWTCRRLLEDNAVRTPSPEEAKNRWNTCSRVGGCEACAFIAWLVRKPLAGAAGEQVRPEEDEFPTAPTPLGTCSESSVAVEDGFDEAAWSHCREESEPEDTDLEQAERQHRIAMARRELEMAQAHLASHVALCADRKENLVAKAKPIRKAFAVKGPMEEEPGEGEGTHRLWAERTWARSSAPPASSSTSTIPQDSTFSPPTLPDSVKFACRVESYEDFAYVFCNYQEANAAGISAGLSFIGALWDSCRVAASADTDMRAHSAACEKLGKIATASVSMKSNHAKRESVATRAVEMVASCENSIIWRTLALHSKNEADCVGFKAGLLSKLMCFEAASVSAHISCWTKWCLWLKEKGLVPHMADAGPESNRMRHSRL
ncbi:unnamed protein product [Polarella glacialis]|uniref:Uncharacterized protein n=1 Tax=Polarella glacialis TaxID=89957 RepID=A0A813JQX7_POLGL|nr:unnamed protein product [Polarella glacialis]